MEIYWYLTAPDGPQPWTTSGSRQVNYAYFQQLARAVDHLGFTGALLATGAHDPWILGASLIPYTERSTHTPPDVVSSCLRMVRILRQEVKATEQLIKTHIKAHESLQQDYDLLTSIPAVGPQLGMNMLIVLRSHDFESANQVTAFMGVAPIEKRSGTSVRSKGPPQLRAKLYMAALCARRCNKRKRSFYEELLLRGKPRMVAIGAVMRKLVHWCYGVLNSGKVFGSDAEFTAGIGSS